MGVLNSTSSINWEQESYPMPKDLVLVPLFALFFLSLRLFLDRYVFENLARRLIFGKNHAVLDVSTDVKRKKINKFKESAWKFIYYLSEELLALSVTYDEPWFTNTKYFWVGPGDQVWPDLKIKLKLKGLYMYSAGFYLYSIVALVFWETRRSDFLVSMAHHVATVILITLSYIFKFARVGSVILAVHEGTDVILEVAKMSKYSGFEGMASICFITFVLCWTVLRLIYYPFWIIWSTSYEVLLTLDMEKHMIDGSIYYYLFNTLLFCLLIIHIYWWKLMVIMVVNQIHARGQISDDVRSDSESDTEHND
ncbi:ceramide synthase 1 LOH3-like isoform X7 [Quercus robur]|uniref:ceramide synthase 1 LOH3-like isoform X7 n=1 Tax=Quercus robur TaxID=38942 RepID=UPI00216387DB|nr:ceramide synthase 1 LOH3-like isoform X7 [Quercus robur]